MGRQETTRRETEEASSHIDRMGENLRIDSSKRNNKQGRSPEPGNHADRRHRQEKCECKSSPPSLKAAGSWGLEGGREGVVAVSDGALDSLPLS